MSGCHCVCGIHGSFVSVVCRGMRETTATILGVGYPARGVAMCEPCAKWWRESQPAKTTTSSGDFDTAALWRELETYRTNHRIGSIREVARQAGVSASTLIRIKNNCPPSVPSLVKLMRWMGRTTLTPFITDQGEQP